MWAPPGIVLPSLGLKLLSPPAANAKGMTTRAPAALLALPPAEQRAPMAASSCSRCWEPQELAAAHGPRAAQSAAWPRGRMRGAARLDAAARRRNRGATTARAHAGHQLGSLLM